MKRRNLACAALTLLSFFWANVGVAQTAPAAPAPPPKARQVKNMADDKTKARERAQTDSALDADDVDEPKPAKPKSSSPQPAR